MTVYPDLAFILGTFFHGAVLLLTLSFLEIRRPWWQILLSSVGAGISSALFLIPKIPTSPLIFGGIVCFVLILRGKSIVGICLNLLTGLGVFLGYLALFLLVCALLFCPVFRSFDEGVYFFLSFFKTCISALLSFGFGMVFVSVRKKKKGKTYCECCLTVDGQILSFRAFEDTGNFLSDPVSGFPVVILEFNVLKRFFGDDFPTPLTYEFASKFGPRARVIPYRSVSGPGQMLSGFLPDRLTVNGEVFRAVIAVTEQKLETRGRFSAIIGIK